MVFQRRAVYDALLRCTRPATLWDLYAFAGGPSRFSNTNPKVRLLNEYCRLLGMGFYQASIRAIEDGAFTLSNEWWRISSVNCNYTMSSTYPFALLLPKSISDDKVVQASAFRARSRLPSITWCDRGTGAVLARSSQPLVGIMMNMRSNADENLVAALCTQIAGEKRRKLYIADARPRKNALANGAMGGGSESSANYFQSEIVFFGIDNIHAMRESLGRLRDYVDTYGTTSSDGMSSFLRHGGWSWGGGNLSSMSASVSTLGDTGWLIHVQTVLAGSAWIAARVALESASVLVHCSDGWDRTSQLVSLASLLLDPYYRTIRGFQALVEKDWLAFGHPFSDRLGMPTVSGNGNIPFELSRQASTGSLPLSPMRQGSGSASTQAQNTANANHSSPIFLQWVDCVSQLLRMYPFAFEFSSIFWIACFLVVLETFCATGLIKGNRIRVNNLKKRCYSSEASAVYNIPLVMFDYIILEVSEKEREQAGIYDACGCLWMHLAGLRTSEGSSHAHYNLFYDPLKHNGPILPPAAALAPTVWPQFHLRWACPSEAQGGEVEAECRKLTRKFSELQRAKELAETRLNEASVTVESLATELRNEKLASTSARDAVKRSSKETATIKRAVQSLGFNVYFTADGDCNVGIERNPTEIPQRSICSVLTKDINGTVSHSEKADLSEPVSMMEDNVSDNPLIRVCGSLCPMHTRDGECQLPNAGCTQFQSQLVDFKANFDAFDRLSIYDSYFGS
uniref:Phosphoprotein phosphatase n=1 Tax=Solanum tuberosum TaxID=4113 RepID=M1CLW4_SOLTU